MIIIQIKKLFVYCIILFFFIFFSCNKEEQVFKKLSGTLFIEELEYKSIRYNDSLMLNILFFRKSKTNHPLVIIPETTEYEKEKALCYLTREKNDFFLRIDSENEVFKGEYKVVFIKDLERKLLGIELMSNDLYLKGFYSQKDFLIEGLSW